MTVIADIFLPNDIFLLGCQYVSPLFLAILAATALFLFILLLFITLTRRNVVSYLFTPIAAYLVFISVIVMLVPSSVCFAVSTYRAVSNYTAATSIFTLYLPILLAVAVLLVCLVCVPLNVMCVMPRLLRSTSAAALRPFFPYTQKDPYIPVRFRDFLPGLMASRVSNLQQMQRDGHYYSHEDHIDIPLSTEIATKLKGGKKYTATIVGRKFTGKSTLLRILACGQQSYNTVPLLLSGQALAAAANCPDHHNANHISIIYRAWLGSLMESSPRLGPELDHRFRSGINAVLHSKPVSLFIDVDEESAGEVEIYLRRLMRQHKRCNNHTVAVRQVVVAGLVGSGVEGFLGKASDAFTLDPDVDVTAAIMQEVVDKQAEFISIHNRDTQSELEVDRCCPVQLLGGLTSHDALLGRLRDDTPYRALVTGRRYYGKSVLLKWLALNLNSEVDRDVLPLYITGDKLVDALNAVRFETPTACGDHVRVLFKAWVDTCLAEHPAGAPALTTRARAGLHMLLHTQPVALLIDGATPALSAISELAGGRGPSSADIRHLVVATTEGGMLASVFDTTLTMSDPLFLVDHGEVTSFIKAQAAFVSRHIHQDLGVDLETGFVAVDCGGPVSSHSDIVRQMGAGPTLAAISGKPMSGKSTLLKWLCMHSEQTCGSTLPLFVSLDTLYETYTARFGDGEANILLEAAARTVDVTVSSQAAHLFAMIFKVRPVSLFISNSHTMRPAAIKEAAAKIIQPIIKERAFHGARIHHALVECRPRDNIHEVFSLSFRAGGVITLGRPRYVRETGLLKAVVDTQQALYGVHNKGTPKEIEIARCSQMQLIGGIKSHDALLGRLRDDTPYRALVTGRRYYGKSVLLKWLALNLNSEVDRDVLPLYITGDKLVDALNAVRFETPTACGDHVRVLFKAWVDTCLAEHPAGAPALTTRARAGLHMLLHTQPVALLIDGYGGTDPKHFIPVVHHLAHNGPREGRDDSVTVTHLVVSASPSDQPVFASIPFHDRLELSQYTAPTRTNNAVPYDALSELRLHEFHDFQNRRLW